MSRRSTRLRARPTTKGRKPQRGPSRRSEQHNGCRSREREIRYTYATYLSTLTSNKVLSCGSTLRREPPPAAPSQALRLDSAPSHKGRARAPARHMQGRACRALATCRPGRPSRSGGLRPKKTDTRMICPCPISISHFRLPTPAHPPCCRVRVSSPPHRHSVCCSHDSRNPGIGRTNSSSRKLRDPSRWHGLWGINILQPQHGLSTQ